MSATCAVCGKNLGLLETKNVLADRSKICAECSNKIIDALGIGDKSLISQTLKIGMLSVNEAKQLVNSVTETKPSLRERNVRGAQQNHNREKTNTDQSTPVFVADRAISSNGLSADFTSKLVQVTIGTFRQTTRIINFSEIVSYTPHFEGHEVKKHHGLTRAATGGLLFGGAGAIVGAVTGGKQFDQITKVGITVRLADGESIEYNLLPTGKTKSTSFEAKTANSRLEDMSALLDRIIEVNHTPVPIVDKSQPISNSVDSADEIRKYKGLLDDGIITQEEFDKKKQQILGI